MLSRSGSGRRFLPCHGQAFSISAPWKQEEQQLLWKPPSVLLTRTSNRDLADVSNPTRVGCCALREVFRNCTPAAESWWPIPASRRPMDHRLPVGLISRTESYSIQSKESPPPGKSHRWKQSYSRSPNHVPAHRYKYASAFQESRRSAA